MPDPALFGPGLPDALPGLTPDPPPAPLVLDAPDGPHPLGLPSVDSDADGLADTVLGPAPGDGPDDLLLATDLDRDGHVDVATVVAPDGSATTTRWGPATAGPPAAPAAPTAPVSTWEPGWDAAAPPAPTLDPATGTWIRMP